MPYRFATQILCRHGYIPFGGVVQPLHVGGWQWGRLPSWLALPPPLVAPHSTQRRCSTQPDPRPLPCEEKWLWRENSPWLSHTMHVCTWVHSHPHPPRVHATCTHVPHMHTCIRVVPINRFEQLNNYLRSIRVSRTILN